MWSAGWPGGSFVPRRHAGTAGLVKCARPRQKRSRCQRLPHVLRSAPLRPDFSRPSDVRSLSFCCCPQYFSVVRWGCPPRAPVCSVALSPPALCDSMGCMCSPPGSSVCPWDFFSRQEYTGGGCLLLQGILPTQGLNWHLLSLAGGAFTI